MREHGARTKKKRREEQQYIQGHHRPAAAPPRAARAAAGPRGRRWIRSLEQDWRSACVAVGDSSVERGASASPSTSPSAVRREARPGSFARPRCADARGRQLSGVAADGPRPGREPGGREERIRRFRGRYREFYMSRMFVLHVPCYATPCCSNPHVTSARGKLGLAWRNRKHLSNPLHSISDGTVKDNGSVRRLRPWLRRKTLRCVRRLFEKRWLGDQEVQRWHTHLGSHPRRRLLSQGLGRNQRLVREKFTAR